jgi:hypothetical protein
MLKCIACGGVYRPVQADGSRYFHVCSPPSRDDVAAAIREGRIGYPPGTKQSDFVLKVVTSDEIMVSPERLAADHWLTHHHLRRHNHRDENVVDVGADGVETIASEGAGVTEVPDPAPAPVTV